MTDTFLPEPPEEIVLYTATAQDITNFIDANPSLRAMLERARCL